MMRTPFGSPPTPVRRLVSRRSAVRRGVPHATAEKAPAAQQHYSITASRYVKHFLTLRNIVLCILCGNMVLLAIVGLLYYNAQLFRFHFWPMAWALLCSLALWKIRDSVEHFVNEVLLGPNMTCGLILRSVLRLLRLPRRVNMWLLGHGQAMWTKCNTLVSTCHAWGVDMDKTVRVNHETTTSEVRAGFLGLARQSLSTVVGGRSTCMRVRNLESLLCVALSFRRTCRVQPCSSPVKMPTKTPKRFFALASPLTPVSALMTRLRRRRFVHAARPTPAQPVDHHGSSTDDTAIHTPPLDHRVSNSMWKGLGVAYLVYLLWSLPQVRVE